MGQSYRSMEGTKGFDRREFIRAAGTCSVVLGGATLGVPGFAQEQPEKPPAPPSPPETNIGDFMKVPRGPHAIPGPFPGRVVQVVDAKSLRGDRVNGEVVRDMVEEGITRLTGRNLRDSFKLFFYARRRRRAQGQPGRAAAHQHPATSWSRRSSAGWSTTVCPRATSSSGTASTSCCATAATPLRTSRACQFAGLQTMDEEGGKWRDADGNHRQHRQLRPERRLLRRRRRGQGRTRLQGRRVLPQPARVRRRGLLLRQARHRQAHQDRQPARLQEHR